MNIMLDTCALLWLAMGDARLSDFAKQAIDNATFAFVSVISGFEITLKQRRGKLILPAEPADWFNRVVTHHSLNVLALDLDDALRAPGLPDIHRDPCDRFIIAAALRLGVPVLTEDSVFADYGVRVMRLA